MSDASWGTSSAQPLNVSSAARRGRIFYGWWIVFTAAVGLLWGVPVTVYTFSVFFKPLMQAFHASRAAISLGYTLQLVAAAVGAPLIGLLVQRYRARRVILVAAATFGSTLLLNRVFLTSVSQLYVFYLLLGLLLHGLGPIPYGDVVSHWFDRRRGLAIGLAMTGIGVGAMLMPPLAQELITRYGLRSAYSILGAAVLLISIPVVWAFLRERPEDIGVWPDGLVCNGRSAPTMDLAGLSGREAWRSGTFWLMVCSFSLASLTTQGCIIHLAPMLMDLGTKAQSAALGSALAGTAVLLGRVGTGYLLDRFFAPRVAALFFGAAAAGIGLLLLRSIPAFALTGAFLVGLGLGAEVDIVAFLISRYFGLRSFAKIYSVAFSAFVLAGALGPLLMGWSFDRAGSYNRALLAFFAATLTAAILMFRLGPYRYRAAQPPS